MTPVKKTILFMHRWLGFTTGLVVFIVSVTGCIYCFQDEIQDAIYSHRKVEVQNKSYIAPSVLKQKAINKFPGSKVSYIYYYGKDRPAVAFTTIKEESKLVFFNPYTGAITYTENPARNFFIIIEYLHLYLLLPAKVGGLIVGTSVLLFVLIMITGIVLWWPKRKTDRKRCFTIKWNGRWRRVNYDLHNVFGFYAAGVIFILAISGLAIAFEWVGDGIYTASNLGKKYPAEKLEPKSDSLLTAFKTSIPVIDQSFLTAQSKSPGAQMFLIYADVAASGTTGITAYAKSLHYYNSDSYDFDKYTGKLLKSLSHTAKSPGLKMNNMNYDIHVGQILGFTGKIIAFLASVVCASLPVTGLIIWLGKRKKPKLKKEKQIVHHRRIHKQLAIKP